MAAKVRWLRPELVVLGRGDPQEKVLEKCRLCCEGPAGPSGALGFCLTQLGTGGYESCKATSRS